MSPDFVAFPACTLTAFLHLQEAKLLRTKLVEAVCRLINSRYYGNNRRPEGVPNLLSVGCIAIDVNANDHWTKKFVCHPDNGSADDDQCPSSPF